MMLAFLVVIACSALSAALMYVAMDSLHRQELAELQFFTETEYKRGFLDGQSNLARSYKPTRRAERS